MTALESWCEMPRYYMLSFFAAIILAKRVEVGTLKKSTLENHRQTNIVSRRIISENLKMEFNRVNMKYSNYQLGK